MSEYEVVFQTKIVSEMNTFLKKFPFLEYQTMAVMIFENEKDIQFIGFQVTKEFHPENSHVLAYTIDCLKEDEKFPYIRISGVQKADNKEPLNISLDYLDTEGNLKEKYTLFEDGEYYFTK